MICDIDPTHGEMQMEPIYHLDGTIDEERGLYWFCQTPGCNGYGGPAKVKQARRVHENKTEQLSMFDEATA